jgi:hypothetical protein
MPDLEIRRAEQAPARRWVLWLRLLGLVVLGGIALLLISLPELASDDQLSGPSVLSFVALAVVIVAVTSCAYVVLRRSVYSRRRAVLIAIAIVPLPYAVAVLLFWLIVTASS